MKQFLFIPFIFFHLLGNTQNISKSAIHDDHSFQVWLKMRLPESNVQPNLSSDLPIQDLKFYFHPIDLLEVDHFSITANFLDADYGPEEIRFSELEMFKIRRRGQVAKGIFIGTIAGALTGFLISPTDCENSLECFRDWFGRIMVTGLGGITGGIIGGVTAGKVNIRIGGDHAIYKSQRKKLSKYLNKY